MATFTPKKDTCCRRFCCIPNCLSKASRNRNVSFHAFPREDDVVTISNTFGTKETVNRRKLWVHKLRMGKPVTASMMVCSLHFKKEDFILGEFSAKRRSLRKDAIPSQNLPPSSVQVQQRLPRTPRNRGLRRDLSKEMDYPQNTDSEASTSTTTFEATTAEEPTTSAAQIAADEEAANTLIMLHQQTVKHSSGPSASMARATVGVQAGISSVDLIDSACQVNVGDFSPSLINVVSTEKELKTVTGIPSFQVFDTLIHLFSELMPESNRHAMSNRKKIMLTFTKLKLNLSFVLLAIMFGSTSTTCSTIFSKTLPVLAIILETTVYWPSKFEILKNMPQCFSNFQKVRVVLDCTEVKTFKAKCLKCRIMSYSHYKGSHTLKYLIGVTPAGMISYISKGYGGRASDKAIFLQSGLINKVDSYTDDIMVDKGFLIKDICSQYNIGLIHPPFLKKQKQFSCEEAVATRSIAKARVHVERAIERVKRFKIVSETIPWSLLPQADNIMVVLCGITNLTSPILADDKF